MILLLKNYIPYIVILIFIFSCEDNGNILTEDASIYGCTDECSPSFNSDATIDDGQCEYTYSYSTIASAIESHGCLGCHTGLSNGNLDLTSYQGLMSINTDSGGIINNCDDYSSSIILSKLDGGSMSDYASEALIDMLTIWIQEGAIE